ncbi:teichoic acid export ATP-binding protein TagH [Sporolactobacillus inulinus]|uniref:Teichoic acid export ATP-binding protein TagH n=1 Tax=Sporolactobacillus inulinus TaxID=2078 RepID=A0A4Y1ZHB9_9BACL|nr:teichoic acid export ATP-binding protein TagH [Sporolactobacillus inulinus]
MEKSVIVKNVSKKYKMYTKNSEKLLDLILPKKLWKIFLRVA